MVKRNYGLRGYIGESVVAIWLKKIKYKNSEYTIVEQIVPEELRKRGGNYLDFGVLRDDKVIAIYEVKTQDFEIYTSSLNKPLLELWLGNVKRNRFVIQDKKTYEGLEKIETKLVTLRKPKEDAEFKLENIDDNIIYFSEILNELDKGNINYESAIVEETTENVETEIEFLKKFRS